jgi:hypothetical protein
MFKLIIASTFCFLMLADSANARLIDDFEEGMFSFASDLDVSHSSHLLLNPDRVLGGDRDVYTLASDGPGSTASLNPTPFDDGIVISSNSTGKHYWVNVQYDGLGRSPFNLNADLASEGHDAFLINISEVSLSRPASIQMTLATNWEGLTGIVANVTLPIEHAGIMRFPYSSFIADNTEIDFTDVDYISVMAKLQTASSMTISEIRTGIIPEPLSLSALLVGVMISSVGRWDGLVRRESLSLPVGVQLNDPKRAKGR